MNANAALAEFRESAVAPAASPLFATREAEIQKPRVSANSFRDLTARLRRPANEAVTVHPVAHQQATIAPSLATTAFPMAPVMPSTLDWQANDQPVVAKSVPSNFSIPLPETSAPRWAEPTPVEPTLAEPTLAEPTLADIVGTFEPSFAAPDPVLAPVGTAFEPVVDASFEATLVGADIPVEVKISATDTEKEIKIKEELEKRRVELELETIWRMLLAKPTAEDLAQYLREVGEFSKQEGGMSIPVGEDFDLARIQPASEITDSDVLQNAEGQSDPQERLSEVALESAALIAAAEASGFENAELARSLLDMMATGASSGLPHERALAADTLLRLLPKLELKPLVMLSERLAMMDNPPHLLVARLIRDPRVEIAGPLLENCMHITDRDLQMVAEEPELSKLRMIARRRKLSRAISDVLIKTGEPSVLLTLVRNMEAEISHEGFNALIAHVDEHQDLLAPLATRTDFTAPFAFELFWHAPAPMRRYILSRFLTDSETLGKILKITLATKDVEEHEDQSSGDFAIMEALDRAARGKREEAADELAAAIKIAPDTALRILNDPEGEPLIVMLKAAGYPRKAINGLLQRMANSDLPIVSRGRDLDDLQSIFETMSFTKARILLTYWDWAQCKSGPYAPVH